VALFAGTAEYYRKYRPGIPPEVVRVLDEVTPQRHPRRLLDIGTGTGLVAEALAPHFESIIAIDNDPDMLAHAEEAVRAALLPEATVEVQLCRAEDFVPPLGWRATLVTLCRAFHWLEQERVLERLEAQVERGGIVAIFADRSFWAADGPWKEAVRQVIQDFLGSTRRAGDGVFAPPQRPYTELLKQSTFRQVQEVRVPVHRTWNTESILGYLYSTSFASPSLFGSKRGAFETAVRAALSAFGTSDEYEEENEFVLRIGRRPQD
jgi:trans-aconitate methyltransferase